MKSKDKSNKHTTNLRRRAEDFAREKAVLASEDIKALSPEETRKVLFELRVHQIELEMQNEELRRAQAELETLRARYFDLYDLAPVGYCTLSEKGLILEANLAAATMLGVSRSALTGEPFTRFIVKADQDIYYRHSKTLFDAGEPQACELRLLAKDGIEIQVHLAATRAQNDDGAPVHRVVLTDITTRKQAEKTIERIHAKAENDRLRLESVMEVLPTGVAITDMHGAIIQANEEFNRIWAGQRAALPAIKDRAVFKACWADSAKPVAHEEWASVQALRAGRPVIGQMLEIQRLDGSRAFVVNSASPIRDVTGEITGAAIAILDVSERWKAELVIQELNVALQKHVTAVEVVNKELESYSHSVSHDLRTPLRFVNRIAHLLLYEPGAHLSNNAGQQVNMILQATGQMAELIEHLLLFSQVSRQSIRKRRVDLRKLFQEAFKEIQYAQKEDHHVEIVIQDLPPCQGERTLLKEVAVNLLTNALKFTQPHETPRITIGCDAAAAETVYFVRDNGVGFDMSEADKLFAPFHRLHRSADFEGTGVGLALVKRIVERHGGRIWVESEINKGATFYFTLGK